MKQLPWVLVGLMALWAIYCIREGHEGLALFFTSTIAAGAAVQLIAAGISQLRKR